MIEMRMKRVQERENEEKYTRKSNKIQAIQIKNE